MRVTDLPPSQDQPSADVSRVSTSSAGQNLWNLGKVAISIGLLTWLAFRVDWMGVLDVFRLVPWQAPFTGLTFFFLAQLLTARRLHLLLTSQDVRIDYLHSLRLTFLSLFASNFLPGTVGGDAIKIMKLVQLGHRKTLSVVSIVADRVINLMSVVLLLPTLLALSGEIYLEAIGPYIWAITGIIIGGFALGVVTIRLLARQKESDASRIGDNLMSRIVSVKVSIVAIFSQWIRKPGLFFVAVMLSLGSVLLSFGAVALQASSIGIPVDFVKMIGILVLIYFVTLLPISFNGIGVREVGMVYLLGRMGATPAQSMAVALLARMFYLVTSLPGAIFLATSSQKSQH